MAVTVCVCGCADVRVCVWYVCHWHAPFMRWYTELCWNHVPTQHEQPSREATGRSWARAGLVCSGLVWCGFLVRSWALILADVAVVVALKISAGAAAEKCFLHKRFSLLRLSSLRVCVCVRVCDASFDVALFLAHVVLVLHAAALYYLFSLEMLLLFSFHRADSTMNTLPYLHLPLPLPASHSEWKTNCLLCLLKKIDIL